LNSKANFSIIFYRRSQSVSGKIIPAIHMHQLGGSLQKAFLSHAPGCVNDKKEVTGRRINEKLK